MTLAELVDALTQHFPKEEIYGLTSQVRRAAVLIPSNIAEATNTHRHARIQEFLINCIRLQS